MTTTANKTVTVVAGGKVVGAGKVKTRTTHDYWHGASKETVVVDADGFTVAYQVADGWYTDAAAVADLDTKVELMAAREVATIDLSTADLDALLG